MGRSIDILQCCRTVDEFELLEILGEGSYGTVYKARDLSTDKFVALKEFLAGKEEEDDQWREIELMQSCHHPSVVEFKEVVTDRSRKAILVSMEYAERNLRAAMYTRPPLFTESEVRSFMWQLLQGVKCLHDKKILHRDLKPCNILLNHKGKLKICDFGLACQSSGRVPNDREVVTLWYRAPELLLGAKDYTFAIDMWSVGCIMAELLTKRPLFDGRSKKDQLAKIIAVLGTPNDTTWPGFSALPGAAKIKSRPNQPYDRLFLKLSRKPKLSDSGLNFLKGLLMYDPDKRLTVDAALNHPWFKVRSKMVPSCLFSSCRSIASCCGFTPVAK